MSVTGEVVIIEKTSEDAWVDLDLVACSDDESAGPEDVDRRGSEGEIRASEDETSTPSLSSSTSILLDSEEEQSFMGIKQKKDIFNKYSREWTQKESHNFLERERRNEILLLFEELKTAMGINEKERWSKVRILQEAKLIIRNLVIEEANLDLAAENLIHENFILQRRLELMKKKEASNSPDS